MENESSTPNDSGNSLGRKLTRDGVEYSDGKFIPYNCVLMQGDTYMFLEEEDYGL